MLPFVGLQADLGEAFQLRWRFFRRGRLSYVDLHHVGAWAGSHILDRELDLHRILMTAQPQITELEGGVRKPKPKRKQRFLVVGVVPSIPYEDSLIVMSNTINARILFSLGGRSLAAVGGESHGQTSTRIGISKEQRGCACTRFLAWIPGLENGSDFF